MCGKSLEKDQARMDRKEKIRKIKEEEKKVMKDQ
jgi:hypothetical protein